MVAKVLTMQIVVYLHLKPKGVKKNKVRLEVISNFGRLFIVVTRGGCVGESKDDI